jgi:hypothetical protein
MRLPAQCPDCARFLAKAFVAGLAAEPAPCPKCGTELTAVMFSESAPEAFPAAATPAADDAPSVRPPDLAWDAVQGDDRDPLAGWDTGAGGAIFDLADYRDRRLQPPPDGAIVLGAGLFGAIFGAFLTRRRGVGALLGLLLGVLGAGAARQVWKLED